MSLPIALDILSELETLAARAGAEIMRMYHAGVKVSHKPDGSPVTEADQVAERMIIERLQELTPDIPIIAEEAYAALDGRNVPDVSGGQFWLVDALDGTREFVSRGQDFTVNIGLVMENLPYLGVINSPMTGMTYSGLANENLASKIFADGRREPIHASGFGGNSTGSLRVISSKSFGNGTQLGRYLMGRDVREHRHRASSIKFCEIAEGRADLYPRFGASCEWDIAAGHAIVLAAGGSVTTSAGQPLLYGKTNFLNSDFLASGAPQSQSIR